MMVVSGFCNIMIADRVFFSDTLNVYFRTCLSTMAIEPYERDRIGNPDFQKEKISNLGPDPEGRAEKVFDIVKCLNDMLEDIFVRLIQY